MPRSLTGSAFMKPFAVLAFPGMYLFYRYNQYKQQQQEQSKRKVTEKELAHLNHKIDKLLAKLEENEPEMATSQEDECVICVNAKATMQTSPCGHRVVCRKCFVKTIQMAVSQRLLPLRCVICRAKILKLKQSSGHGGLASSKSWLVPSSASSYSVSAKSWSAGSSKQYWNDKNWVPTSVSQYSMTSRKVPNSASMFSMESGSSSLSGMSSVSSSTHSSASSRNSSKAAGNRNPAAAPAAAAPSFRQPNGYLRKTQQYSTNARVQEFKEADEKKERSARLAPIAEFQRDFRLSKAASSSTRIRCAQKIVTQLEATPSSVFALKKNSSCATATFNSSLFFKSRSNGKEDHHRKKDKKDEKQWETDKSERRSTKTDSALETENGKSSGEKKKTKKEGDAKGDTLESKSDKKASLKEFKTEKVELKSKEGRKSKGTRDETQTKGKERETNL